MSESEIKFGIPVESLDQIIKIISGNSNVTEIILFGSRAIGNFRAGSDIDIALKGDLTLTDKLDILIALDKLELPYKFDLLIYSRITEAKLIEHIDRVGVVLERRDLSPL
jgi:predicted nucleotidyltransferase